MPRTDALLTVIDGHEMDLDSPDEVALNTPTATCTYGSGPDVTLTVGKHVVVKLTIAETVNLIADLQISVDEFTKRMQVFTDYYDNLH